MSYSLSEFSLKLQNCLDKIKLIFDQERSQTIVKADIASHQYGDKYILAEQLTNCGIASVWNALSFLGISPEVSVRAKLWAGAYSLSLRFEIVEACSYVKETVLEEESSRVETEGSIGALGAKISTKVITKITEYHYKYECVYRILLFRGAGANLNDDFIEVDKCSLQQMCIARTKTFPAPETRMENIDCNISWVFSMITPDNMQTNFIINRNNEHCFTPSRNPDIKEAQENFFKLSQFASKVSECVHGVYDFIQLYDSKNSYDPWSNTSRSGIFVPICPVFHDNNNYKSNENLTFSNQFIQIASKSIENSNNETAVVETQQKLVALSNFELNSLLNEQIQNLKLAKENSQNNKLNHEKFLCNLMKHICEIVEAYGDSIDFIEYMIRNQLISAIGKELTPNDFGNYMRFHYRKLLKECYQPRPFCNSIRRTDHHSPEGTVRIDMNTIDGFQPIMTFSRLSVGNFDASNDNNVIVAPMEFSLNAATKVLFRGERYVHGWLGHSFSNQSMPDMQLIATARQFSGFIVLLGRIASEKIFDPKYAFILQNKEEITIPLLLEKIPTPKQFKDAIKSLSPEQQRFCKAYRSMQLESTLFGICVIQIKPQLEKVLNLSPDSLTKEIKLTQDLMKLFIEYQIPSDLLSFDENNMNLDGFEDCEHKIEISSQQKLDIVKENVQNIYDIINNMKQNEINEKDLERDYYGTKKEESSRSSLQSDSDNEEFGIDEDECDDGALYDTFGAVEMGHDEMVQAVERPTFFGNVRRSLTALASGGSRSRAAPAPSRAPASAPTAAKAKVAKREVAPKSREREVKMKEGSAPTKAPTSQKIVNAPPTATSTTTKPSEHIQPSQTDAILEVSQAAEVEATEINEDFTQIPTRLDSMYEEFDKENAVRPTIINIGETWTKSSLRALVSKVETKTTLEGDALVKERNAAFDLLDALTKSGGMIIEDAQLHVVIAATHSFDETLMNCLVQQNKNPIESVERSSLIMMSALFNAQPAELVSHSQLERLQEVSKEILLIGNDS